MKLSDVSPNKQVVMNENTLGYLIPTTSEFKYMGVHHGSVLKGSTHDWRNGPVLISPSDKIRPATPEDFEAYNVSMKGFFEPVVIEVYNREKMISKIEGITGALKSVPWNKISTEDMHHLFLALKKD